MKPVLFVGPTLSLREVRAIAPDVEVRPPAACGDVYRAAEDGVLAIGLVDGYFEHRLSVWHKEILWALSKGAHVYGAASMGALRAAELSSFGMVGVGRIFEAFQAGALEADDEVAVVHAPEERGYTQLSEALVNVRATLAHATKLGVIDSASAEAILFAARSIFYPERTFNAILNRALQDGLALETVTRLRGFLGPDESGKIDQKKTDALLLLDRLRQPATAKRKPSFHFEYTEVWHEQMRSHPRRSPRRAAG